MNESKAPALKIVTSPTPEESFDALLAEMKSKHGVCVGWLDDTHGPIICRKPTRPELKTYLTAIEQVKNGGEKLAVAERFMLDCHVYPEDAGAFRIILDDLPGLAAVAVGELQALTLPTAAAKKS